MVSWPTNWRLKAPDGYQRAANVIIDYDGGNHSIYGRLLSCGTCGAAVMETAAMVHDNWHELLQKQLSGLHRGIDPRSFTGGH